MGNYINTKGIECYLPDNGPDILYIDMDASYKMDKLIWEIQDHFGKDIDMSLLEIGTKHIQTNDLRYYSTDSSDFTDYIVIKKIR